MVPCTPKLPSAVSTSDILKANISLLVVSFLPISIVAKVIIEQDELHQMLNDYYAQKAEKGMNKLWESGQWSKEKDEEILKTHLRTPYKIDNRH